MRNSLKGVAAWLKNSFIDFPGTVSTVLFFSGCNLRCPYCHNGELITNPPDLSDQTEMIWDFLQKRRNLIDGIVLSGGEPTLHPHLKDAIEEFHAMGYQVMLNTNGLLPKVIESFNVDYLAVDIKTIPQLYKPLLHASYDDIPTRLDQSLSLVRKMKDCAEVRITLAPEIITKKNISILKGMLQGVHKVILQPLNTKNGVLDASFFESLPMITQEQIHDFQEIIRPVVGSCTIREGIA